MKNLHSLLAAGSLMAAFSPAMAAQPALASVAAPAPTAEAASALAAAAASAQAAASGTAPSADLVISAVGDIMLDASARPVISGKGYDYPFARVRKLFKGSQVVFGNLEGPLTNRGTAVVGKKFTFRSPPGKVSQALKKAGFTVVSLANNHMLDYGPEGLAQTIDTLDKVGIEHAGAGADLAAARRPAMVTAAGKKIAILAYSITYPESYYAARHKPGTAFAYEQQVRADVIAARKKADIVLVSYHWGQEGKTKLRGYQKHMGHLAIDCGASAVIGSHPHILQGIEHYKNGVILYSMGNFTFGSYSSHSTSSAVATLRFHNGHLVQVKMYPINVNNFNVAFQPKPLHGKAADAVIDGLEKLSAERHTAMRDENGVGVVNIQQPAANMTAQR